MLYNGFYRELLEQSGGAWFDFEGLIRDIYVSVLTPGSWAIDAGAHHGDHTFQMAQAVAPNGRVVAIEAVPSLVKGLKKTSRKIYPHLTNIIELHCCGVSDSERREVFYFAPDVPGLSGLRKRDVLTGHPVKEIKVPVTTLDRICAHAAGRFRFLSGRFHFLKIDIEGGEYHALLGATGTIGRDKPVIVFEHNATSPSDFNYSMAQMLATWSELNYNIYDFFGNPYDRIEAWDGSMVWNFLAIPRSYPEPEHIFEVVRSTLARAGIVYRRR
jgi:FkbM family methyltransferase